MSERMTPIPFGELVQWMLAERRTKGAVFGVERPYRANPEKTLPIFGETLETPFGPAAGPHTQLAQNIAAAYYGGARFFELKTVQIMDGEALSKCIPRPCILAEDEGYNCEWSTELTVPAALGEYIKGWFLCKLMAKEFGLGGENGFVFNMSVGYDFAGITGPKIDGFIEGLKDASGTEAFRDCKAWLLGHLDLFENVDRAYIEGISPRVCRSITLSTLHGCPPAEIEKIASYLITEKKLHTYVKCNPTILGYESARRILDGLGYDYIVFDDHHFREDLQYGDAVPMFKRLSARAAKAGVEFGLKLSNTFPVDVTRGELPSGEMYMSGRALYPLTIEMANRITEEFDGGMRLSFSGGADACNIAKLFEAGIWPITIATTVLKPGGYQRMGQIAARLAKLDYAPFTSVGVTRVRRLAERALADPHHKKPLKPSPPRKLQEKVPLLSCFTAPCAHGCPIGQDIPEYVELAGKGEYTEALRIITEKNPLPFITGTICSHRCMDKCTRGFYEEPVRIRNAKLLAAEGGYDALMGELKTPEKTGGKRTAVVGGGPAGMAAAYFLARGGVSVTLFEKRESLGGVVRHVIPAFRIAGEAIDRDAALIERVGVEVKLNTPAPTVAELKHQGYENVILAVGAWAPGKLRLEQGAARNVMDFLLACKAGTVGDVGKTVCVVGGGNTAMDAARAAKRLPGVERVCIVYRRNARYMPADAEELHLAERDGVEFMTLLAPKAFENGLLRCVKCELGAPDASGRRSPVETGEPVELPCDTLIAAVGEGIERDFFAGNGVALTERGRVNVNPDTLESSQPSVFVIGDANRGPATVAEAIADAQKAADAILGKREQAEFPASATPPAADCRARHGRLMEYENAKRESERCLHCSVACECCASACPNRANLALTVPGMAMRQILHIDRMCNECGNCEVFCPYDSAPYRDKLTLYHTKADFDDSENQGFLTLGGKRFLTRLGGEVKEIDLNAADTGIDPGMEAVIWAVLQDYAYLL